MPIIDTSFVVAKRIRAGQSIYVADARHLHHRLLRLGFSERRAVLHLWAWCGMLAAAALATRFVPFREGGRWHAAGTVAVAAIAVLALAFSVYVVYLLEIVKVANPRLRRRDAVQEHDAPAEEPAGRARSA